MPDHTKPFYMWCDASEKAYGAVLMQRDEESDVDDKMVPVEFMSKVWQPSQMNWGMTTKEMAAMKEAIKKWSHMLLYNHFHVHTDAKNVEWLWKRLESMNKKGNPMHSRWMYTLKPYSFDVKHIRGVENVVADWLSRYNDYDQLAQSIAMKRFDETYGYDSSSESESDREPEYVLRHDVDELAAVAQRNTDYKLSAAKDSDDINGMEDIVSIIKEKEKMKKHRQSLMLIRHQDDQRRIQLVDKDDVVKKTSIQILYDRLVDDLKCEQKDDDANDVNRGGGSDHKNLNDSHSPTTEELYRWHEELQRQEINDEYIRDLRNQQLFYVTTRIFDEKLCDHSRDQLDFDAEHILFLRGKQIDCSSLSHDEIRKVESHRTQKLFPIRDRNILRNPNNNVNYSRQRSSRDNDDPPRIRNPDDLNDNDSDNSSSSYSISPTPSLIDSDEDEWNFEIRETPTPPPDRFSYDLDTIQQYELLTQPLSQRTTFDRDEIIYNQKRDPYLRILRNVLESRQHRRSANVGDWKTRWKQLTPRMKHDLKADLYYLDDDCLMYIRPDNRRLIVLPPEHRKAYLEYYHHNMLPAVHASAKKMAQHLLTKYYWPGFQKDIKDYVRGCVCCQLNKGRANPYGLMKLFTPIRPGQMVSIDNKGPIEPRTSNGNLYITSIIDRFSGKVWATPVKAIDSYSCCRVVMKWIAEEGVPDHLLSDHGRDFVSNLVQQLLETCGIKQLLSTTYHPECNGTIERWHRTMGEMMKCIGTEYGLDFSDGDEWDSFIPLVVASHNNTYSERIKMTPNEAYSGRRITFPVDKNANLIDINDRRSMERDAVIAYNDWIRTARNMAIRTASLELEKYDRARRDYYERLHKPPKWRRGMKVFHWAGPKYSTGLMMGTFKSNWSGPYRIKKVLHEGSSYKLDDGEGGSFTAPLHRLRPCYDRDLPGYGNRRPRHNRNINLDDDRSSSDSSSGDTENLPSDQGPLLINADDANSENDDFDDVQIEDRNVNYNDDTTSSENEVNFDQQINGNIQIQQESAQPTGMEQQENVEHAQQSDPDSEDENLDKIMDDIHYEEIKKGKEDHFDRSHYQNDEDDAFVQEWASQDYDRRIAADEERIRSQLPSLEDEKSEDKTSRIRQRIDRKKARSNQVYRPSSRANPAISVVDEDSRENVESGPRSMAAPTHENSNSVQPSQPPNDRRPDNRVSGRKRTLDTIGDVEPAPSSKRNRLKVLRRERDRMLRILYRMECELDALDSTETNDSPSDNDQERIVHDRGGRTTYFGRL